jgi:hypothetical protein
MIPTIHFSCRRPGDLIGGAAVVATGGVAGGLCSAVEGAGGAATRGVSVVDMADTLIACQENVRHKNLTRQATPTRSAMRAGRSYTRPMQCNIDSRGRRARLTGGIVSCSLAAAAAIAAALLREYWTWLVAVAIALLALGVFQIFEAVKGWCALRAMGIRTKV